MKIWKQMPLLLSLTMAATGFQHVSPVEQSDSWASETPESNVNGTASLQELMPFLEDMFGQIQRAESVPSMIAAGPRTTPPTAAAFPLKPVASAQLAPLSETRFNDRWAAEPSNPLETQKGVAPATEVPQIYGDFTVPATSPAAPAPVVAETPTPARLTQTPSDRPEPQTQADVPLDHGTQCPSCEVQGSLRFMECSPKNKYLENQLARLRGNGTVLGDLLKIGTQKQTLLKAECMRSTLMTHFDKNSKSFRQCGAAEEKIAASAYRPCVSENYFSLINNSFDAVARCMGPVMGVDEKDLAAETLQMFAMFKHESGMHMNAGNSSGASGFGQLTQSAIRAVNLNALSGIKKKLTAQGGVCEQIADQYLAGSEPMRASTSYSCDRISLKTGNPMTNLIYSFGNVFLNRKALVPDVLSHSILGKRFELSTSEKEELTTALSIWAHNTGLGGMKVPLVSLLNDKYKNKKVTDVKKFIQEMSQAMRDYPHSANSGRGRKLETATYFNKVQRSLLDLQAGAGGGSCLNE